MADTNKIKSNDLIKWAATGAELLKARTATTKEKFTSEEGVPLAIAEADWLAGSVLKLLSGVLFLENAKEDLPESFYYEMDIEIDNLSTYL